MTNLLYHTAENPLFSLLLYKYAFTKGYPNKTRVTLGEGISDKEL